MKHLLLFFGCLFITTWVSQISVAAEGEECPAACSCTEEGVGPYIARCLKLRPEQNFGGKISRLVIENDNALVIDKNTFESVGLQNVSTIQIKNCTVKKLDAAAFSGLEILRIVEFNSVKKLVLHPDMFSETKDLTQLVIKNTDLKFSKKSDYLFDISFLRELVLSNTGITQLHPDAFSKMPNLMTVNLAGNKLKSLGKEFVNLMELEEVDLSHNLLGEVGNEVFENKRLDVLKLRGNHLTSMAGVILPDLTELDVSLCKFSRIDKTTFSGFSLLNILNLSGNALSEIAEDTFSDANLSSLTDLDLSNNALQGPLPEGLFQKISGLGKLNLAHNPKLQVLPEKIFKGLRSLFNLDLSVCGLKTLEGTFFEDTGRLSFLNLAGNDLSRLKPGVLNKYITKLDLSHNKFEHLEDIKFPSSSRLRKLYLTGNKLTDLPSSAFVDLLELESLDLSECSLSSFWNAEDPKILERLQTLSVAKNHINAITEEQLALTPNLMGIDITDNPLVCNETFSATLKWFRDHNVKPNANKLASLKLATLSLLPDTEDISPSGWGEVQEQICGEWEREPVEPVIDDNQDDLDGDEEEDEDGDEEADEDDDEAYDDGYEQGENDNQDDENYNSESRTSPNPSDELNHIVWRQSTVLAESNDNYLWSVIIVLFSVVAILFSLTILAACVLRWSRQRNSYGARMINTLHPPMSKRGRSSIYQQLFEDPNHPTTPIMSVKNANQTRYNFPEVQGGKQSGYITYLSKDFHDSTVIPEPV